jgi:CxxC motif-containing protein (DUF1111 family)
MIARLNGGRGRHGCHIKNGGRGRPPDSRRDAGATRCRGISIPPNNSSVFSPAFVADLCVISDSPNDIFRQHSSFLAFVGERAWGAYAIDQFF